MGLLVMHAKTFRKTQAKPIKVSRVFLTAALFFFFCEHCRFKRRLFCVCVLCNRARMLACIHDASTMHEHQLCVCAFVAFPK